MNRIKIVLGSVLFATVFGIFTVSAQTPKRRPAKPLATPLPTLTGAEIISRAGEYEDPSAAVSKPQKSPSATSTKIRDLSERVDRLETNGHKEKEDPEAKQRRMLLNLDILTRAEQRSESLRKQLFEMSEKENTLKSRIDQIEIDARPEMIERELQQNGGSMRPEELREARRRSLDLERTNLENLLSQLQVAKAAQTVSLEKADALVEKLRTKLDKDIDEDFLKDRPDNP